jgi:RimJ/RimL family protein N-acetyltransferase
MSGVIPAGVAVDPTPAPMPGDVTLKGRYGFVERLSVARHGDALWATMGGQDHIWAYIPAGKAFDEAGLKGYVAACESNKERMFYAVVDGNGKAVGFLSLMEIRPAMRVIEVGNIVYSPALQRTPLGTEAQYLIARYAIETLGYRRYEWKCDSLNAPSRRAAIRLGFIWEGRFRNAVVHKGRNRDTDWFSIIDLEWPRVRKALDDWLDDRNFDAMGRQRVRLAARPPDPQKEQ